MLKFMLVVLGLGVAIPAAAQAVPICLRSHEIQDTKVTGDRTIEFRMLDGSVWQNTLVNSCPELKFNGFSYVATPPDQICGNLQSIRVIRSGAVCLLGPFTKLKPSRS
jgi:hypothetical protein